MSHSNTNKASILTSPKVFLGMGILYIIFFLIFYYMLVGGHLGVVIPGTQEKILFFIGILYCIVSMTNIIYSYILKKATSGKVKKQKLILINVVSIILIIIFTISLLYTIYLISPAFPSYEKDIYYKGYKIPPQPGP